MADKIQKLNQAKWQRYDI